VLLSLEIYGRGIGERVMRILYAYTEELSRVTGSDVLYLNRMCTTYTEGRIHTERVFNIYVAEKDSFSPLFKQANKLTS
jgi:hypothetical protein